jgi:hypothetical protein
MLADLQARLKRGRLSSLSHMLSFLLASRFAEEVHIAFVKATKLFSEVNGAISELFDTLTKGKSLSL